MGKYVGKIIFSTEWQGDQVRAELEPLDREGFLRMESIRSNPTEKFGMVVAAELLEKHLISIGGVTDAANSPISKEVILSKVYFLSLVTEIFQALIEGSIVGKATTSESAGKSSAGIVVQN
jgi:hypothetical protein